MDLELSDEQKLIQETARDFTDREIVPAGARQRPRGELRPRARAGELGEMGYLGAPVAEEYGGRGLDYVTYGLIVEEVGRGDSSMRTVVSVQTSLVCGSIERWGSEEQKKRVAAAAVLGRGARLLRASPSPTPAPTRRRFARGPRRPTAAGGSRARRCGSRSATSPRSRWSSPRPTPSKAHRGLACFLVPTASDGYAPQEIHGKLGLRASDTARDLARRGRGRRRRDAGRDRRRLQGRDERARLGPLQRRRGLRRDLRGLRRRRRSPTRPSASSSASRSPASSSSRS